MKPQRKRIPAAKRRRVLELDNHECQICGFKDYVNVYPIIPQSKGGKLVLDNLVTLCANHRLMTRRGQLSPTDFETDLSIRKRVRRDRQLLKVLEDWGKCANDPKAFAQFKNGLSVRLSEIYGLAAVAELDLAFAD